MDVAGLFIDVKTLPQNGNGLFQLLCIGGTYGYILMGAANLIADGSELLLLVPSAAGLVGSVVLPVLGAVPDGCIVLFSGIGPNAQDTLNVGVGALAGSTIMLLTVPWFLSVLGGRVNIVDGKARYKAPKLTPPNSMSLTGTGVGLSPVLKTGAWIMIGTAIPYAVLQLPAMFYEDVPTAQQAMGESKWSLLGMVICVGFFMGYLWYQYKISDSDSVQVDLREAYLREAIESNKITLLGVMHAEFVQNSTTANGSLQPNEETTLIGNKKVADASLRRLEQLLNPFFKRYDVDDSGVLEFGELGEVLREMGEKNVNKKTIKQIFGGRDFESGEGINYEDFVRCVAEYAITHQDTIRNEVDGKERVFTRVDDGSRLNDDEDGGEEEEQEEFPPDLCELTPDEQQRRVKFRALWMMALGTLMVLILSDPMVDVLQEIGVRTGVPAFYVSFVLAPLASNVSEVVAAYNYSQKKTTKSMKIAISTLQGAAVMNNTFVLGIFMFLIYSQMLSWEFFAETAAVLLVQIAMAAYSMKSVHTLCDALIILSLYPASLCVVAALNAVGWD